MNLIDGIAAYLKNGDRTVINTIMSDVESDFIRNPTRERLQDGTAAGTINLYLPHDHQYISYRIRAMRSLILRNLNPALTEHPYFKEFQRCLSVIYIDIGVRFQARIDYQDRYIYHFELSATLFSQIEAHMSEIEEWFRPSEFRYFHYLYTQFKEMVCAMEDQHTQKISELNESAVRALEYALKYVDISKSPREIVKYVNKAFISKFTDFEAERNGMRRIQRKSDGVRKNSIVKVEFPEDINEVILGPNVRYDESELTEDQLDFMAQVRRVVETDKLSADTSNYTCTDSGAALINKKYVAEKLGVSSDIVRQKISRIRKRLC